MTRVSVFIDYQNTYKGARAMLGAAYDPDFTVGQVFPRRLGVFLCDRGRSVDPARQLEKVQVYRGEPSAKHSPKGQSACQRQIRFWLAQAAVEAFTRPLKYYDVGRGADGNVIWEPREKGIDVMIALAMVMGAVRDDYDVAVLMSADSDLAPAVETVQDLGKRCEVASWDGRGRISTPGRTTWCHWLDNRAYRLVQDPTDYTQHQPGTPPSNP